MGKIKVTEDYYLNVIPTLLYFPFYHIGCDTRVLIAYEAMPQTAEALKSGKYKIRSRGWRCERCDTLCDIEIINKAKFILNQPGFKT